ncbi:rhomboid family intramembrane serine protease [Fulvivirga ligni]|uniref:rhomboid family intramembrane serine protease n=1 Tax=Fulvivirga ligni TaxID=2904246 RepID=UPI001F1B9456|nr:rhomboid family intramembrane serine protease [Fulvivirga ligni]UII21416.1 rhomboid family intramembrane serine protease [Fulvivirga ligni]
MMQRLTPVVKNLLLINILVYILQYVFQNIQLHELLALWSWHSPAFRPYQFLTYMFVHDGFMHIFFNMLMLVFIGPILETTWGPKKFLIFYMVTGIGAGILYNGVGLYKSASLENDVNAYIEAPNPDNFALFLDDNGKIFNSTIYDFLNEFSKHPDDQSYITKSVQYAKAAYDYLPVGSMVGASGAVYGLLLALGILFPEMTVRLLFPPIPIKVKYLVFGLGAIEIYSQFMNKSGDGVAHLAHLGGIIFAFIMIKIWQKQGTNYR